MSKLTLFSNGHWRRDKKERPSIERPPIAHMATMATMSLSPLAIAPKRDNDWVGYTIGADGRAYQKGGLVEGVSVYVSTTTTT